MFKWSETITTYRSREIKDLKEENDQLTAELESLKKVLAGINNDITSATAIIDFDSMRVFSIERLVDKNRPTTVIGYWMAEPCICEGEVVGSKDVLQQWYLFCNNDRHEDIVKQFKEWKEKQNG